MDKMASKTTIKKWACKAGAVEELAFAKCKFSPDQVADLERILEDKERKVNMTIHVAQKKLQIDDIKATVKLDGVALTHGGQDVQISGFKSPDTRAQALKALVAAETPVEVTFEEREGKLFREEEGGKSGAVVAEESPSVATQDKKISFGRGRRERVELSFESGGDVRRLRALCRTPKQSQELVQPLGESFSVRTAIDGLEAMVAQWFKSQVNENAMTAISVGLTEGFDAWREDLGAAD